MTEPAEQAPIRLALDLPDAALARALAGLLAGVRGLRIVSPGEPADAAIGPAPGRPPAADTRFTPREIDVLELLATGASNKAIARELGISVHTAKFHVRSLMDKLDAVDRTEALAQAARQRVIHL